MIENPTPLPERFKDRLFQAFVERSPVAMALFYGPNFTITLANQSVLEYWGRTHQQVINKPLFDALPEASGQGFEELLTEVYTTGKQFVAKELVVNLERNGKTEPTYIDFVYDAFYDENAIITGITVICTEVTAQVLAKKALQASENYLRNIILKSPAAMCLYQGPEHVVETANERMIEFWGRPAIDIMGKPMFEGLPEARNQGYEALLDHVYATGEPYTAQGIPVNLPRAGGIETIHINLLYEAYREADGDISGVIAVAVEVTDQIRAHRKLQDSETRYQALSADLDQQVHQRTRELAHVNEVLQANNQAMAVVNDELTESTSLLIRSNNNLQQFAYVASHDLQEPLRKIQQFGDLLITRHGEQLGEGVDYLNRMLVAASRMSTLIRDLLTYSRISTQRDSSDSVLLTKVVSRVLTDLELVIEETGATVRVEPLPTLPGDARQLSQLFQNLLSNALKFRRPDTAPIIQINARLVKADHLPPQINPSSRALIYYRIAVTDNGIGFDEKYLSRIFQVFQRLHGKNDYAGTGIGLAICEKVATNHGGAITATSQPGQGATFSVYLPV